MFLAPELNASGIYFCKRNRDDKENREDREDRDNMDDREDPVRSLRSHPVKLCHGGGRGGQG